MKHRTKGSIEKQSEMTGGSYHSSTESKDQVLVMAEWWVTLPLLTDE